jgi:hypothetical protein
MQISYKTMPRPVYKSICTLFFLSTLFFIGCSDNPTGGISGTGKTAPVLDTGIFVGQVDSVNQLSIDGVAFDAAQAEISINGKTAQFEELRMGMSVVAKVDYRQKTATSIMYQPLLSGPIETTSDDKSIIEVLGQTISVTPDTHLDSLTVEDIFQDNIIEVSGSRDASGNIVADYIRVPDLEQNYYVVGGLESESTQTLLIGGTSIDSQSLMLAVDNRELTLGTTIKAELLNPEPDSLPDTPLFATGASIVTQPMPAQFETVTVKNMVTAVYDSSSFRIKNFIFSISDETTFLDANGAVTEPFSIQENQKLKVVGYSNGANRVGTTTIMMVETHGHSRRRKGE